MTIYSLEVARHDGKQLTWYFDVREQFDIARAAAARDGALMDEGPVDTVPAGDFITAAHEFLNWYRATPDEAVRQSALQTIISACHALGDQAEFWTALKSAGVDARDFTEALGTLDETNKPVRAGTDDATYRELAIAKHQEDGEVEIDSNAIVSESDTGAYVQAWVWVDAPDVV